MATTRIDWCDKVWNPITGCTPCSPGCAHCYAQRFAKRLAGRCGYPADDPFRVTFHRERLAEPSRWRKPQTVFVCSMGDLFHGHVKKVWLQSIWRIIEHCPQHRFLILTKRPYLMRERIKNGYFGTPDLAFANVWLGVSVSTQGEAERKIPLLLSLPCAGKFVSVEPMLEPVNLTEFMGRFDGLSWVICGGETGPGARRLDGRWVNDLRQQCWDADVPFWYKQANRHGDDVLVTRFGPRTYKQTPWGDWSRVGEPPDEVAVAIPWRRNEQPATHNP